MAAPSTHHDELIARYVEPDPNRPGLDQARILEYGVQVWALILYLRGMNGDAAQVAAGFDVPIEAVKAAEAYYRRRQAVIDNRMPNTSETW